jgi:RNA polymerase sigma factor (sigma-70 family)
MPEYSHEVMRHLEAELSFIPARLRIGHVQRMAGLIPELAPDTDYAYGVIFHTITQFVPDSSAHVRLIGKALRRDLGLLLQRFSLETPLDATDGDSPVIPINRIAAQERITHRTIRRWALQGLALAYYQHTDGHYEWGVRRDALEQYHACRKRRTSQGASKLSDSEREAILLRLTELEKDRTLSASDIIQTIRKESGRSAATIRRLRNKQKLKTDESLQKKRYSGLSPADRTELVRLYREGTPVAQLAKQLQRSASTIYHILHHVLVDQVLDLKTHYIPSPEFAAEDAEENCLGDEGLFTYPPETPPNSPKPPKGLPAYLKELYRVPLLDRQREGELFRKYNYIRYHMAMLQEQVRKQGYRAALIDRFDELRQAAGQVGRILVRCNLRLVVSVAKRHTGPLAGLMELVSEGNMCLMRAVDCFDYQRNVRFATYATWAMTKHFARVVPEKNYRLNTFVTGRDDIFALVGDSRPCPHERTEQVAHLRGVLAGALKHLPERERVIVQAHFGTDGNPVSTLEEIGHRFGLTRERIRQIEVRALKRLRDILGKDALDALT